MLIDDTTPLDNLTRPENGRGLVPRNYATDPPEMFAPPSSIPLIPRSEWDARIQEQDRTGSSLEHLWRRSGHPHLVQGEWGYCWGHSVTHTLMTDQLKRNAPFVPLSAFALCATIKKGANEGGWCGLAAKFARDRGIPSQALWPQGDADYRRHDTPEVWADAAKNKIVEDWVDLTRPVWGQNLTFDQVATCLLLNIPCALDFNWWAHSVCGVRLVRIESGSYGVRILNSWERWGEQGFATLQGSRAIPDGAVATRAATAA